MKRKLFSLALLVIMLSVMLFGCNTTDTIQADSETTQYEQSESSQPGNSPYEQGQVIPDNNSSSVSSISLSDIPAYASNAYVAINNNQPQFSADEVTASSYEYYSELDSLGRCGIAIACIGIDLMPTGERGSIGQVKPTGWHTIKYDIVDGKYLYNRCHLIGYQLSGENANTRNLITGTRYLNIQGMLPFENMVADYVKETNNHVMYRVSPVFEGNNLLASGVQIEGYSVEDNGDGICFNVYAYNVQPGILIEYLTGDSQLEKSNMSSGQDTAVTQDSTTGDYILNTNSKKFHYPDCYSASTIKDSNKESYSGSRQYLIDQGYEPCKNCNP